jgi:hypothetical protein
MKCSALKSTLTAVFCLSVFSLAALPEIRVTTQNNAAINSTSANWQGAGNCVSTNTFIHKYTAASSITLTDPSDSRNNISVSGLADSIRGRGNSTWNGDKKPYRIKFGEHQSMFGQTKKHKSWALIANWYDPTFALNAVAFELGKRLGLEGTPNSFFVDFYLNGSYKGIYQITDIVHVNKGRVEVDEKEGWLAEFDYHCPSTTDEVDFLTTYPTSQQSPKYKWTVQLHTFIKSPETNYDFVKKDINNLTTTMFNKSGFPENGYRDLVDLDSYAKYLMVELFMDNFDFICKADTNGLASNFAHKDKGGKIKAGPLWDLDLTAGVDDQKNFPKHFQYYNYSIKPKHPFYKKFFDDPVFLAKWKKTWDKYKSDFQDMTKFMDSIATYVEGSVEKNFALQKGGGFYIPDAPATKQAYKDGVGNLKTWWNNRINFFQQEITKMNIDTSKDIVDPSSSSNVSVSSSSNISSSSSDANSGSVTLSCTGLQATVEKGAKIAEPILTCSNNNQATNPNWTGRPQGGTSWDVSATTNTPSYTISVAATCGSAQTSATCGTVVVGNEATSIGNFIVLKNLPSNTKIEVYNLQGKLVYSSYPENPKILRIGVQTKGIYIIKTASGTQRMVVK